MGDRLQTGKPPQNITSHAGQLSLLPSVGREMSTGQSAVVLCGCGVKAGWLFPSVDACDTHTHTTTVLRPFFRDYPGEPVPGENFWTLWCKGRLTEADTQTIQLGATPSGLTSAHPHHPPIFYRPDALPATQPTVSKH